jgi:hypothetical protein
MSLLQWLSNKDNDLSLLSAISMRLDFVKEVTTSYTKSLVAIGYYA